MKLDKFKRITKLIEAIASGGSTAKLEELNSVLATLGKDENINAVWPQVPGDLTSQTTLLEYAVHKYITDSDKEKVRFGHPTDLLKAVEILLAHNANINFKYYIKHDGIKIASDQVPADQKGDHTTPLLHQVVKVRLSPAQLTAMPELLKLFYNANGDFNITNGNKETVFHALSRNNYYPFLVLELEQYGAGLNRQSQGLGASGNPETFLDLLNNPELARHDRAQDVRALVIEMGGFSAKAKSAALLTSMLGRGRELTEDEKQRKNVFKRLRDLTQANPDLARDPLFNSITSVEKWTPLSEQGLLKPEQWLKEHNGDIDAPLVSGKPDETMAYKCIEHHLPDLLAEYCQYGINLNVTNRCGETYVTMLERRGRLAQYLTYEPIKAAILSQYDPETVRKCVDIFLAQRAKAEELLKAQAAKHEAEQTDEIKVIARPYESQADKAKAAPFAGEGAGEKSPGSAITMSALASVASNPKDKEGKKVVFDIKKIKVFVTTNLYKNFKEAVSKISEAQWLELYSQATNWESKNKERFLNNFCVKIKGELQLKFPEALEQALPKGPGHATVPILVM